MQRWSSARVYLDPLYSAFCVEMRTRSGFGKVAKVATVLGVGFGLPPIDPEVLREREARRKARLLVRLTQGTMGLEAQAVSAELLKVLEEETTAKLLAENGKKLWG